ncbi:MAG: hydantoinase/oxoprolinase family protein [Verrucomicrobiae bacterium]|nr:hydantoinase/oxoprolinase family protein [Verrucomicrobiae bacterium]
MESLLFAAVPRNRIWCVTRIGIDIGGTFTDLFVLSKDGKSWSTKVLTTPRDLSVGFIDILERALQTDPDFRAVAEIVHATTVATNAILENDTARLGMITTRGFRDVLEIGRHFRRDLYNFFLEKPPMLVPRQLRLEVAERVAADGSVVTPLNTGEVEVAIDSLLARQVEVILVCFLHSYARPDHEQQVAEIVRRRCNLPVLMSHAVCPEYREYERFSTTTVHGAILPKVRGYLENIQAQLTKQNIRAPLSVMQSSGGIATASQVAERPGAIIESGPAAGVISAVEVGRRLGFSNFITFDMGGTTTKASLVRDGTVTLKNDYEVGGGIQGGFGTGYPLRTPVVDVVEIGTGGGSLCYVDAAGHLHVGPRSAGADPGPACYDRGGTEPTITDAHAVLGRMRPEYFAGGQFSLKVAAARNAIERAVARPLGLGPTKAAEGILALANEQMVRALELVSIQRGYDPRTLTLVAFGGAGPLHAAELAGELGCPRVVIPPEAGVQSAWGLLVSDCRRDYSHAFLSRVDALDLAVAKRLFESMVRRGSAELLEAGFARSSLRNHLTVDARYVGQAYEVVVQLREPPAFTKAMVARITRSFHQHHQRLYGHSDLASPVEWVTLRASVTARVPRPAPRKLAAAKESLAKRRYATQVMVWNGKRLPSPVYHRSALAAGDRFAGPALIIQEETTVAVPPGFKVTVERTGDIVIYAK